MIYTNHNNKFCMASPEAVVQRYFVIKLLLKFTHHSQENTCIGDSNAGVEILKNILKSIYEQLLLYLKYYTPANNTVEPVVQYS